MQIFKPVPGGESIMLHEADFSKLLEAIPHGLNPAWLKPAAVVNNETAQPEYGESRKSNVAWVPRGTSKTLDLIELMLAGQLQVPVQNAEQWQYAQYEPGGYFKPHWDAYNPTWSESLKNKVETSGNRYATAILYLHDADGPTVFPELSLSIQPEFGKLIYFYNLPASGWFDPLTPPLKESMHGSEPLSSGLKHIAVKWFNTKSQGG